jgi:predicted permease
LKIELNLWQVAVVASSLVVSAFLLILYQFVTESKREAHFFNLVHVLVSSSLLGPADSSFRALAGRLNFTIRRHKFKKNLSLIFYHFAIESIREALFFNLVHILVLPLPGLEV